jgi:hypothetical protein
MYSWCNHQLILIEGKWGAVGFIQNTFLFLPLIRPCNRFCVTARC